MPNQAKGECIKKVLGTELSDRICGFCGKPGDEEKPLKVWISPYNETRWFYHDSCLWEEMDREELG